MIELPEAVSLSKQINETISGKHIKSVIAAYTPHKLAWYYGDKTKFAELLTGKAIEKAGSRGGLVEIQVGKANILLGDGVNLRFHKKNELRPAKHQLLVEFTDGTALSAVVQMYGGLGAFLDGELDNKYYLVAKEKPSPLSPEFDKGYFDQVVSATEVQKLSLKALLATEQRIPGLGNGVLQDILFNGKLHPKKRVSTLAGTDISALFNAIKTTLSAMASQGGRDTELDLFGNPGDYKTILCKNTVGKPCPVCGTTIKKEAYMGGSVYYCEKCQKV